jgi:dipeptidyl aminopeptidase/acylaminoacyl peptidase
MKPASRLAVTIPLVAGLLAVPFQGHPSEASENTVTPVPPDTRVHAAEGLDLPVLADTVRTLQPEDLFRLHSVSDVRFSPDGERMAFELVRPGEEGAVQRLANFPSGRSDVWISSMDEADSRPLTAGAPEGMTWFHPRWSPDGERLAFLSVEGNEVRAWVWTWGDAEPRRLSDRPVHLTNVGPLFFGWVGEDELALAVRPEGAPERGRLLAEHVRPGFPAAQAWEASWSGREVTAAAFTAGPQPNEADYLSRTELVVFHLDGSSRTAAEGRWGLVVPSPDGRWVATFSGTPVGANDPRRSLQQNVSYANRPGAVPLTAATGEDARDWEAGQALQHPLFHTLRWAPDGSAYALLTRTVDDEADRPATRVAVYRPQGEGLEIVDHPAKQVEGFAWTGDGALLVHARRTKDAEGGEGSHWWRPPTGDHGEWEKWTAGMETVPDMLVPLPEGAAGVAEGALWRFEAGHGEKVLEGEQTEFQRLLGAGPPFSIGQSPPQDRAPDDPVRILAAASDGPELWTVGVDEFGAIPTQRFRIPAGARAPADVAPGGTAVAFSTSDGTGTWLWCSGWGPAAEAGAALDTVLVRDRWIEGVEGAETRRLTYTGPDGEELTAWMLLPPDREAEGGYPTVLWIYPGTTHGARVPFLAQLNGMNLATGIGALQLLASRGYAVLLPSIPLDSENADPRPQLEDVVMSAVDRAVEEGLTDPSRLGLLGQSYGGFGVTHLVSQTDRFQAAVASASITHLRSFYGTFDARGRYGHMAPPLALQTLLQAYFESGQGRMGAPPALAPERYREASPLTYVDEVDTPLMLIHGDQDFVPIQQAEMFFSELLRLGKTARLVRYAGEGHTLSGRANVLDMWDQIFSWFDEFLVEPESGVAAPEDEGRR